MLKLRGPNQAHLGLEAVVLFASRVGAVLTLDAIVWTVVNQASGLQAVLFAQLGERRRRLIVEHSGAGRIRLLGGQLLYECCAVGGGSVRRDNVAAIGLRKDGDAGRLRARAEKRDTFVDDGHRSSAENIPIKRESCRAVRGCANRKGASPDARY